MVIASYGDKYHALRTARGELLHSLWVIDGVVEGQLCQRGVVAGEGRGFNFWYLGGTGISFP